MSKKIRFYVLSEATDELRNPEMGMLAMLKSCGITLIELRENEAEITNDTDGSIECGVDMWVCEATALRLIWFKLKYGFKVNKEYNLGGILLW